MNKNKPVEDFGIKAYNIYDYFSEYKDQFIIFIISLILLVLFIANYNYSDFKFPEYATIILILIAVCIYFGTNMVFIYPSRIVATINSNLQDRTSGVLNRIFYKDIDVDIVELEADNKQNKWLLYAPSLLLLIGAIFFAFVDYTFGFLLGGASAIFGIGTLLWLSSLNWVKYIRNHQSNWWVKTFVIRKLNAFVILLVALVALVYFIKSNYSKMSKQTLILLIIFTILSLPNILITSYYLIDYLT